MQLRNKSPLIAIACGGTGGHLFPGLAIAEELVARGCDVQLLISPKDVDQKAVKSAYGMEVVTLPAVALNRGGLGKFLGGFWQSYRTVTKLFKDRAPEAVLAMGSFTSAPPVMAGKSFHAATFLHEANTIPGRANRWLAPWVDEAFLGFPEAARRLASTSVLATGTPVRTAFQPMDAVTCRIALGLDPERPALLVMGGSQGASGINELVVRSLALLSIRAPELQFLHLTGAHDLEKVSAAYAAHGRCAIVHPFLTEMEFALGAATAAISRAGASSLAEFAAMQLPAILIPYPAAVDNHQFYNARACSESGAAWLLEQKSATPEALAELVVTLTENTRTRDAMREALRQWHKPDAARRISERILKAIGECQPTISSEPSAAAPKKQDVPRPLRCESRRTTDRRSPRKSRRVGVTAFEKQPVSLLTSAPAGWFMEN
jgi:UDP-N-acetylglucosamine--N-acetylmuramyl-(pentapeptide) pyrophosphoryl-undecaprenol N-acetylglucosamine transferase